MSKIALDLKQFKHVKSDDKSTTLQHQDGHMLTLSHSKLSKEAQGQLQQLAGATGKPLDRIEAKQDKQTMMAEGGDVPEQADPNQVRSESQPPAAMPAININVNGAPASTEQSQPLPKSPTNALTDEQWAALPDDKKQGFLDPMNAPPGQTAGMGILNKMGEMKQNAQASRQQEMSKYGVAAPLPEPVQPMPQQQDEIPRGVTAPVEAKQAASLPNLNDIEGMMKQGYEQKLAGITQAGAAQGQMGVDQEKALNNQVIAQNAAKLAFKQQYDMLEKERQAHMADIKNAHIDPEKYWNGDSKGNGSHSKIAAGIGMILAGFNPTTAPNAAVNFLKNQMEMNLDAQKQNLTSNQNLLAANLRQFGNLRDATEMTRLMQTDIVHNELMAAAAKAQTPMAKAAAMQAAGQLQMDSAPMFQNFAMRRAMMQLASSGTSGDPSNTSAYEQMIAYKRAMGDHAGASADAQYLVSGVGVAKKPVPEDIIQRIPEYKNTFNQINEALNFKKTHPGASWSIKDRAAADTLMSNLGNQIRVAEKMGVFKQSEAENMISMLGHSPADFMSSLQTDPKLKEMLRLKQGEYNNLLSTYGLPPPKMAAPTNDKASALAWAKANPGPKADKILQLLGK